MGYYLAPALDVLRDEINARWPGRDKASDGWIGDTRHQATKSDHNPNTRGSVNALDIDEDGIDIWAVFAAIKKHPSARYFIYERKLYHRLRGWKAENYSGTNPHDKHAHLSIEQDRDAEQDRRPWGIATAKPSTPKPTTPTTDWTQEAIMSMPTLKRGAKGRDVARLQGLLCANGYTVAIDQDFGPKTGGALGRFQVARSTKNSVKGGRGDEICGRYSWTDLLGA